MGDQSMTCSIAFHGAQQNHTTVNVLSTLTLPKHSLLFPAHTQLVLRLSIPSPTCNIVVVGGICGTFKPHDLVCCYDLMFV
jgi:hypothetical protein